MTSVNFNYWDATDNYVSSASLIVRRNKYGPFLGYLQNNLKYVNSLSEMIAKKKIDEKQLFQVLRMLDHRKHVGLADVGDGGD
jgi:hypothetical protein